MHIFVKTSEFSGKGRPAVGDYKAKVLSHHICYGRVGVGHTPHSIPSIILVMSILLAYTSYASHTSHNPHSIHTRNVLVIST